MDDNEMEMFFTNVPKVRRVFFGRKDVEDESIFEKIFKGPFNNSKRSVVIVPKLISYVWKIFQLNDIPEILVLVSLGHFKAL